MARTSGIVQRYCRISVVILVAAVAACGGGSTTPTQILPASTLLVGVWTGNLTDNVGGAGSLTLSLQPRFPANAASSAVTGSWQAGLAGNQYQDAAEGVVAPLSGTHALITARCSFAPPVLGATALLMLSVDVVDRKMTGTYQSGGCSGFGNGTIDLTRQ